MLRLNYKLHEQSAAKGGEEAEHEGLRVINLNCIIEQLKAMTG